ncbi:jg19490 [Pararge aegeria aegeria]|uniref:Glycine cleavage system H protein n=1 Tax=Pararge aegeria aegeria TaxID=348720 RepID=A0A8S4RAK4_9NEOP|nr:jg19490 [Pararge aegeria aegeria]
MMPKSDSRKMRIRPQCVMYSKNISRGPQKYAVDQVIMATDHMNIGTRQNNGRYYTRDHEWVTVDAGVGTVGISNYAQEALGEVVFVQLPEVGSAVASGDECGAVESVKAASEIVAPVSGTIVEKNSAVESTPSLINKSYFDEGWLFRVKLSAPDELKQLMDQTARKDSES